MCFYCNRVDAVSEQQHNLDSRERFSGKVSKLGCILVFTYVSLLHEFWVRWVMLFCFHISHGALLFHPLLLSLYVKGLWIWTVFFDIIGFFLADNFDISTLIFHWHRDNFFPGGVVVNHLHINSSDTLGCASCATFLFLPHFDVLCDLLLNRRTGTWNLFKLTTKLAYSLSVLLSAMLLTRCCSMVLQR